MDIKKMITDAVDKIKNDKDLAKKFQDDPISTVEGLLGVDVPNDQVEKIVEGIQAKLNLDKLGAKVSRLGFGCMRLPVLENKEIDIEQFKAMVDYAMENGINYFDTAWGYHGGESEIVTGKALAKYPRESYYLADKFPGYDVSNMDKVEEIFEKQLKRLKVDYFDFYLFHNVCEKNIDKLRVDAYCGDRNSDFKSLSFVVVVIGGM